MYMPFKTHLEGVPRCPIVREKHDHHGQTNPNVCPSPRFIKASAGRLGQKPTTFGDKTKNVASKSTMSGGGCCGFLHVKDLSDAKQCIVLMNNKR